MSRAMVKRSNAAAGNGMLRAEWVGYAACGWALVFSFMHLYWGIEAATAGTVTVPGWTTTAPRGSSIDWVLYGGILCVVGVLVALLRFRGERLTRRMQLSAVGAVCAAMTAYVAYTFSVNGFMWLIVPGVLCAVGAVIALALIQAWGRAMPCEAARASSTLCFGWRASYHAV
jgi:hypothetical protein